MSAILRRRIERLERMVARLQHGHEEKFDLVSRLNAGRTRESEPMTAEREAEIRDSSRALRRRLAYHHAVEQARTGGKR